MKNIKKVITHSNSFHIDEVFAIALIKKFWNSDIDIQRTRNEDLIDKGKQESETIVIDVGREYDEEKLIFDHHQKSFIQAWTSKDYGLKQDILLSSTGLIFNFLLKSNAFEEYGLEKNSINFIRENYIIPIDSEDNGIEVFNELSFINNFNTNSSDKDKQFKKALDMTELYLANIIERAKEYNYVFEATKKAVNEKESIETKQGNINVVNSKRGSFRVDFKIALKLDPTIDFFISERSSQEYSIVTAPASLDDMFSKKHPIPEKIINMYENNADLSHISIRPIVFIHKDAFISIIKGNKEDALEYIKNIKNFELNIKKRIKL